jgi:lipopolysaccharide transport system permease protein
VGDYPAAFHDADFTLFFGRLAGMPSTEFRIHYLLCRTFALDVFFQRRHQQREQHRRELSLITKIYFPRMIIPMASVASGLLDFLIAFGYSSC